MPITPGWRDTDKHIYQFNYTYPVSDWQEYRSAVDVGMAEAGLVDHPVIILFDPGDIPMPPGNPLPHLRYAVQKLPDNMFATLAIVDNHFAVTMMSWIKMVGFYHWLYVLPTRAEAETQIKGLLAEMTPSR